jgi:hypothetical protein
MLKFVLKAVVLASVVALTAVGGHKCGYNSASKHLQESAFEAGVGGKVLDHKTGEIIFVWVTPFGLLPATNPQSEAVSAPPCDCCDGCKCGCHEGGPCTCHKGPCDGGHCE